MGIRMPNISRDHNLSSSARIQRRKPDQTRTSIGEAAEKAIDDGGNDDLFRYTAGRWLWGEEEQLSRRYVKFNVDELVHIAMRSTGSSPCVAIKKLPEGGFNKVLLLTMSDGKDVIARIPNPNAGRPHFTTASEVATMQFVSFVSFMLLASDLRPLGQECSQNTSPTRLCLAIEPY